METRGIDPEAGRAPLWSAAQSNVLGEASEGTITKHLETMFRVLGVDGQAAAVVAPGLLIG